MGKPTMTLADRIHPNPDHITSTSQMLPSDDFQAAGLTLLNGWKEQ